MGGGASRAPQGAAKAYAVGKPEAAAPDSPAGKAAPAPPSLALDESELPQEEERDDQVLAPAGPTPQPRPLLRRRGEQPEAGTSPAGAVAASPRPPAAPAAGSSAPARAEAKPRDARAASPAPASGGASPKAATAEQPASGRQPSSLGSPAAASRAEVSPARAAEPSAKAAAEAGPGRPDVRGRAAAPGAGKGSPRADASPDVADEDSGPLVGDSEDDEPPAPPPRKEAPKVGFREVVGEGYAQTVQERERWLRSLRAGAAAADADDSPAAADAADPDPAPVVLRATTRGGRPGGGAEGGPRQWSPKGRGAGARVKLDRGAAASMWESQLKDRTVDVTDQLKRWTTQISRQTWAPALEGT